jgi:methylated-DNA-[protein]-cysteine S-methyltransferase
MRAKLFLTDFQSPIGKLFILSSEKGLLAITFTKNEYEKFITKHFKDADILSDNSINKKTINELKKYFDKKQKTFNIPMLLLGTEFQKKVWMQLLKIPYGEVISYKELAKRIKMNKGFQAVGQANSKNPIPILIPCHRVITNDLKLGGYGGGLDKKKLLLKLEGVSF